MARRPGIFSGLLFVLLLPGAIAAESVGTRDPRPTPMMSAVQPDSGRAGDVLTVAGIYLDVSFVRELYLTSGGRDVKAEIIEQSATAIRFKIPTTMKPGRYCLTVLTTEEPPNLLEQPAASLTVTETR